MVLGRIQVLLADYDHAGGAASLLTPELRQRPEARLVSSLEEASRLAGFWPNLPGPDLFTAEPSYSVADVTSATLRLRTPAIRFLYSEAGGSPSEVPSAWNGAVLDLRVGPVIVANYEGVLLLQSLPFQLVTPTGFDLEHFYRVALQALGMDAREAFVLGADLGISPALLTFMPMEDKDLVRAFTTGSGSGVMIKDVYGPGKIVAVWSGFDRIYALYPDTRPVSRDFALQVANVLN